MTVDPAEHLPLVRFLERKYASTAPDPAAVHEVAVSALLGAARGFRPERGSWSDYLGVSVSLAVQGEAGRQRREAQRHVPLTVTGADGQEYDRPDLPSVQPVDGTRLMAEAVRVAVAQLPPREARVVALRFGLDGEEATLEETGRCVGLSRERVRQLEAQAVERLRKALGARRRRS